MSRNRTDCSKSVVKWIMEDCAIAVRVLRLRSHLSLYIPWVETANMVRCLKFSRLICDVPDSKSWLTIPEYLNSDGHLIDRVKGEFETRKLIYDEWNLKSQSLGIYAEELLRRAFADAGYFVRKAIFDVIPGLEDPRMGQVEIDAYCVKNALRLGVQVKNVTSEVFIDPNKIRRPSEIYLKLIRQFDYCSRNGIVPILISPFIEGSFYCFDDQHEGLHCQTYLQLFNPENETLCRQIKEILRFGNVRVVEEVPAHIIRWIDKIPDMYMKRQKHRVNRICID